MAETFHYFPRLPTEIRQEIWSLVVRDVKARGAHYLELRPYPKHKSIEDCAFLTFTAPHCGRRCKTKIYPLVTLSGYWEHANPSTYLRDGGMWAACKESRQMMQRKFYPRENTQLYCLDDEYCPYLYIREEEPFTGLFYDACLTTLRWLTLLPDSDLFILPINHLKYLVDKAILSGTKSPLPRDLVHVGVEYDPDWGKGIAEFGLEGAATLRDEVAAAVSIIVNAALNTLTDGVIFLIDYRLQCDDFCKTRPRRNITDFAANGGWFVCDRLREWHMAGDSRDAAAGEGNDEDEEEEEEEEIVVVDDSLMYTDASIYPCADFVGFLEDLVEDQYRSQYSVERSDTEEEEDTDCNGHCHAAFNVLTWCPT